MQNILKTFWSLKFQNSIWVDKKEIRKFYDSYCLKVMDEL